MDPPIYLYWLALGVAISEEPIVWHLLVFPWVALMVFALDALERRVRLPRDPVMVAAFVLSPAVLPGINLMLDIPALALMLTALVLVLRALESGSVATAATAGIVLVLACET